MALCTSANTTNASLPNTFTTKGNRTSLSLATAVPLTLGVLVTSLKLVLWRARFVAQSLDEDAERVWTDGSMMVGFDVVLELTCLIFYLRFWSCDLPRILIFFISWFNFPQIKLDCSDEGFHQHVIQSAIDRGTASLESISTSNVTHASAANYYQSNSSSGESSENDYVRKLSSFENETDGGPPPKVMLKPKRMSKQVGGMASHKRPVLTLDNFILKPLRLLIRSRPNKGDGKNAKYESTMATGENERAEGAHHKTKNDHRDEINDKTKAYRGVREVAFYEALEFASSLSQDNIGSCSKVFQKVGTGEGIDSDVNTIETRHAVISLLSLYENASKTSITSASNSSIIQTLYPSSIRSFRHPCIGHRRNKHLKTESVDLMLYSPSPLTTNPLLSKLGYFNSMAFLAAYYAGDPVVLSSVQSYARTWCALIEEVAALKRLSKFTSPYYGVIDLDSLEQDGNLAQGRLQHLESPHLLLKNLTAPFSYPNIIDIKMGTQTYEPAAPLSKQVREEMKYPQQSEIGFRIVGMRVYSPSAEGDENRCWDKSFGANLTTRKEVMQGLMTFFRCGIAGSNSSSSHTHHILSHVIQQLTEIKKWFEAENATLAFYGSSILILYDGCQNLCDHAPELVGRSSCLLEEPILKMIDFAHVCRESGRDTGYLKGVKSLLSILEEMRSII